MNKIIYFLIILLVVVFLLMYLEKNIRNKLSKLLFAQDMEGFEKMITNRFINIIINPFDSSLLKLHKAMLTSESEETDRIFEYFDKTKLTAKQKNIIYSEALNYYQLKEDKNKIDHYCRLIQNTKNIELKEYALLVGDIYVNNGYKYLDELEKRFKDVDHNHKASMALLIGRMYRNKGNENMAQKYDSIALELIK